ncbi:hypothetical protein BGZ97_004102 [Linnemannia gamsii]|uniref:Uncharacterized protein n=1 Tax=Linnemannia gamsii TaxID=64522 RepID=A0A9P6UVK3_9FUNG|nr:hypothetical protein BGZ97_004102 [Linnemannia gamsii]
MGRLDSPLNSHASPTTQTVAHITTAHDNLDWSTSHSECGHRLYNVQGVHNWHRFRVEMLRQTVEETYQSLLFEPALDSYDLRGSSVLKRFSTPSSQSSRIVQHHYIQRTCLPSTPPIRHPNQSSQDEFRHVLLQVDWAAIWHKELVSRSDTIARSIEPTWREDVVLETNEGFADSPRHLSQDSHHQYLYVSGNTTHFDEQQHPVVDTFPSSAGIRVKPLQPKYTDPRLKFPTVYDIDSCSKGEGVNVLSGDRGTQLSRHPSGQVKVIRSLISERPTQNKESYVRNSINDREETATILDDCSNHRIKLQAEETRRYCSFYADLPDDPMPCRNGSPSSVRATPQINHALSPPGTSVTNTVPGSVTTLDRHQTSVPQTVLPSTTPLRPMTPFHCGFTTTSSTPSTSTQFASIRMRSPKVRPCPIVVHSHPSKSQDQGSGHKTSRDGDLLRGKVIGTKAGADPEDSHSTNVHGDNSESSTTPISRPKSHSLRTKRFSRSSAVIRDIEQEPKDTDTSEFLKLHRWVRTLRHQQDQQTNEEQLVSSHLPRACTRFQEDIANISTAMCLNEGGDCLKGRSSRKMASIGEEVDQNKAPQRQEQECKQRRNGKQFFKDAPHSGTNKSKLADKAHPPPQEVLRPQTKRGRVAERWKPKLAPIPIEQDSESVEPSPSPSYLETMATTTTTTKDPQANRKYRTQFAAGHDARVNSQFCESSIPIPRRTSSTNSIASGSSSPTRSSTRTTIPIRSASSGNSTFPSIVSILKKPTRINSTTGGTIHGDIALPAMIRDPRMPQRRSRLIEKGVKFVPNHAPRSIRLDKTIELIRLARQPLEAATSNSAKPASIAAAALPSPISPTGSAFSQSSVSTCPTTPTSPTSTRSPSLLSPTTAESDYPFPGDYNTNNSSRDPRRDSYEDIILSAGNATKTVRDLILSPPQSTRIVLTCTTCNRDFQVTDQDSLRAFAGHVMQCDNKVKGKVDKVSKSLSSSMVGTSATFQRMRSKLEGRLLRRESIGSDDYVSVL